MEQRKATDLGDESSETADGVGDGRGHGVVTRIACPEPNTIKEERKAEEAEGKARDDLCEEPDLALDGGEFELGLAGHLDESAHHGPVTGGKDETVTGALCDEGGGEGKIASLEGVVGRRVEGTRDHVAAGEGGGEDLRWGKKGSRPFTGEERSIKAEIRGHLDDAQICGDAIAGGKDDDVARDEVVGRDGLLFPVADDGGLLCNEGLDGLHDATGIPVDEGIKGCRDGDDDDLRGNERGGPKRKGDGREGPRHPS